MTSRDNVSLGLYRIILTIRKFEEAIAAAYGEQEMRSPTHLCTGQEAVAAGVCAALDDDDKVVGYYRGHGYYLAKGGDPREMMAEFYCKRTGANRGKGGSMLLSSPKVGYVGSSAMVGGGIPIATGIALAASLRSTKEVCVSFFGDGAAEEGVLYESLNFAALRGLPVVFVCENNLYAVQSHIKQRQARPESIFKRAEGFGIPSIQIDGNDPDLVYEHAVTAVERARAGDGPSFIEALTYRWHEHVGPGDDTDLGWRPKAELDSWKARDPLLIQEKRLVSLGLLDSATKHALHEAADALVRDAFEFGKSSPLPDPEELMNSVY